MSVNKLGTILLSGFLMFATAPLSFTQSTDQDTTKKQTTTQKGTTTKDAGKATTSDTQSTSQSTEKSTKAGKTKSQSTEKSTTGEKKTGTTEKSTGAKKGKKTSGLSNEKVRRTQMALKEKGFDPGPIDGIMGPLTMTSLRNYQSHNHLEVTGNINAETEKSLMGTAAVSRNRGSEETQPYSTRESLGLSSESKVSSVEDVRQIQQALADLMYDPGEINGMMTSQTQQAVREFQWLNNLPATGTIDEQTKIAINTQAQGGFESAQLGKTYSSSAEREKPEISTEEQTQTRTDRSTSTSSSSSSSSVQSKDNTYDTRHDSTAADVKKDRDRDKDTDKAKSHEKHAAGKPDKDAAERISKATGVLQDLTAATDKRIPNELLQRAEAIAVIPNMIKGALGIGGRYGKGVVSQRADNGRWSAPSFIHIGGGSFGAQLGVTSTDLVLVFTDRKALSLLEGGKDLKLGVDAGVVAGPVGRSAEAGVNANLESAIYAYSRSKGLFAGIALDGAVLALDKDMNEKVYGSSVDAKDILNGNIAANSTVRPFTDALDKAVPKKRISQKRGLEFEDKLQRVS